MMTRRTALRVCATAALASLIVAFDPAPGSQAQRGSRQLRTAWLDGREVVDGEVIVRYRTEVGSLERARAEFQTDVEESESIGRRGARRLRSRRLATRAMLQELRDNPDVEFAEPNYVIRLDATPNDPAFNNLWGLFNFGQSILGAAGIAGADISAPEAWDLTTGSRSSVIGVIDTGIDYTHPDLAANMWRAPRQFTVTIGGVPITCAAGTYGFNAITNTCNPFDDHYHGTHVAGTIGAVGNNGVGVAGVNWTASMMGLKFLSASGSGSTADAIKAIEFAIQAKLVLGADANVRILSNSWGGGGFSQALKNQIDAANAADMLFVAAAGNRNTNNDISPHYPSSYASSNVVSVASMTNTGARSSFSSYGAASVHLGAPGSAVYSTMPANSYAYLSGTSMATPHVAGAAALILSQCAMTTAQLKSAILGAVDPAPSMAGVTTTGGRLNANAAVRSCTAPTLSASISGSTISVTLANGPGNVRDWIGLFCPAGAPDSPNRGWKYLNNLTTVPSNGVTSATVTFPAPAGGASGTTCNARFFINDSMNKRATSQVISIAPVAATVTVAQATVNAGQPIDVTVANGTGNPTDWLALFPTGAADAPGRPWMYLNGLRTAPATGLTSASVQFTAPSVAGTYEIRFFANDGFVRLGTSNTFTVVTPPALTISDVSVVEGNSGTATASFRVELSPTNPTQTVSVTYATANGTASWSLSDYQSSTGTLSFAPGASIAHVTVPVYGDTTFEPDETFQLNLINPVNGVINDGQGIGTIVNDDARPQPAIATSLVGPARVGQNVPFSVANGPGNTRDWVGLFPANAPDTGFVNWVYLSGTRTPPSAGVTAGAAMIAAPAQAGSYNLRLFANDGQTKLATTGTFSIQPVPSVTINDVSVAEGNAGTSNATFTVTIAPADTAFPVVINYATAGGTATSGVDFGASTGSVTFTNGVSTQAITVPIYGDTTLEANETFAVNLTTSHAASAVTIADATGIGTIANDEAPPPATIASTLSGPARVGQSVPFSIVGGPGNQRDWVGIFPAGAPDTGFVTWVYLSGSQTPPSAGIPNGTATIGAPVQAGTYELRLFANDTRTKLATSATFAVQPVPSVTINDVSITEGDSGTSQATFTVSISPADTATSIPISYTTTGGTSTSGVDFVSTSGIVTFTNGVATRTISVPINGDAVAEQNETFSITLSTSAPSTTVRIADSTGAGTILNDDGALPSPTVTPASQSVPAGRSITVAIENGPGSRTDWVAIFPVGGSHQSSLRWYYLNGLMEAPFDAVTSARINFAAPRTPGTYEVRFFANNGFTLLATSAPITITPSSAPAVTASYSPSPRSDYLEINVANGPGSPTDWVGLVPVGLADNQYVSWAYLNGNAGLPPAGGMPNATFLLRASVSSGTYEVRLFTNNGFVRVATSGPVVVP